MTGQEGQDMASTLRRTWAEIDLDALAHNYQTLRGQQARAAHLSAKR